MKPCRDKRQLVVWSVANALQERQQRKLEEHLRCCPGCRDYLEEMLALKENLNDAFQTQDLEPSAKLHQRITQRVLQSRGSSVMNLISMLLSWQKMRRRILAGAFALTILSLLFVFKTTPETEHSSDQPIAKVPKPKALRIPGTSFAEYRQITERSLDDLDIVLAKQGNNFTHFERYTVSSGAIFAAEN